MYVHICTYIERKEIDNSKAHNSSMFNSKVFLKNAHTCKIPT